MTTTRIILLALSLIAGLVFVSAVSAEDFKGDLEAANNDSAKTQRPLVVIISGDHCGWCEKLKSDIAKFPDAKKYNLVTLEADSKFRSKLIVPNRGIPQIHRWTWNGKSWDHVVNIGYIPPAQFKAFAEGRIPPVYPLFWRRN